MGRDLAAGEGAVGEIVERSLAADGLVDRIEDDRRLRIGADPGDPAVHRVVRRRDEATEDFELAIPQDVERGRRVERVPDLRVGSRVS
jgi:hypothetical protein